MTLLIISFIAGVLTVLAPCILPLLPVIIGGSLVTNDKKPNPYRPLIIAGSLVVSIVLFSLLLKATTSLLSVPDMVWQTISGIIVVLLGLYFLLPQLWYRLPFIQKLTNSSNALLGKSYAKQGNLSAVLIGLSLGPVFNSCSPTYALVVAGILPVSFLQGLSYLLAYAIGLGGMLLVISYGGKAVIGKLGWLSNPSGGFHKLIGVLFILVGVSIILGVDKKIQTYVLEQGWYDPISKFEESLQ